MTLIMYRIIMNFNDVNKVIIIISALPIDRS
jgi:hypothetical protein